MHIIAFTIFLQKSCYWSKISHFVSICICWTRIIMTFKLQN